MISTTLLVLVVFSGNFHGANPFTTDRFRSTMRVQEHITSSIYDSSKAQIDFESIYNIEEKYSQEEALKSGIKLTKLMRQVTVDHKDEIKTMNQEIRKIIKKKAYSNLAYLCFDAYVRKGKLTFEINEDRNGIKMDNFDNKLMDLCFSKYGMKCVEVKRHGHYTSKEWILSCDLHDEGGGKWQRH